LKIVRTFIYFLKNPIFPKNKKLHLKLHFIVAFIVAFRFYTADPVVWNIYSKQKFVALEIAFPIIRCISILLYFDDADHDFLKKNYKTLEC
jgi:hypothetical protein